MKDQFGTQIMTYEDIIRKQSNLKGADDKVYKIVLEGKWEERDRFSNEERAQIYQIEL